MIAAGLDLGSLDRQTATHPSGHDACDSPIMP